MLIAVAGLGFGVGGEEVVEVEEEGLLLVVVGGLAFLAIFGGEGGLWRWELKGRGMEGVYLIAL